MSLFASTQDMPVVHASDNKKLDLDDEDQKKFHYRAPAAKLDAEQGDDAASSSDPKQTSGSGAKSGKKGKGKDKGAMEYTRSEQPSLEAPRTLYVGNSSSR